MDLKSLRDLKPDKIRFWGNDFIYKKIKKRIFFSRERSFATGALKAVVQMPSLPAKLLPNWLHKKLFRTFLKLQLVISFSKWQTDWQNSRQQKKFIFPQNFFSALSVWLIPTVNKGFRSISLRRFIQRGVISLSALHSVDISAKFSSQYCFWLILSPSKKIKDVCRCLSD